MILIFLKFEFGHKLYGFIHHILVHIFNYNAEGCVIFAITMRTNHIVHKQLRVLELVYSNMFLITNKLVIDEQNKPI